MKKTYRNFFQSLFKNYRPLQRETGKCRRLPRITGLIALAIFFSGPALQAQDQIRSQESTNVTTPKETTPVDAKELQKWRERVRKIPKPKAGCFQIAYPETQWQEVECIKKGNRLYRPKMGPLPTNVGNGNDYSAQVTGQLTSATGGFEVMHGVTSITDSVTGQPDYSVQLNSEFFTTPACSGAPNPSCQGWQQFIYSSQGSTGTYTAFMQYWLVNYGSNTCPAGWNSYAIGISIKHCYKTSASVNVSLVPDLNDLIDLQLTGAATAGGNDEVTLDTGILQYSVVEDDNILNLAGNWQIAEFNIVGDGNGAQANFNSGSKVAVKVITHSGTTDAPLCNLQGFTGEKNNLFLSPTTPILTQPSPTMVFEEELPMPGGVPSCRTASGIGDTHLYTFEGLHYDFQATGDFILAKLGSDFVVQNRQVVSTSWPNASVNNAVGVKIGKTRVAVCLTSPRLKINGQTSDLEDGGSIALPDGGYVSRNGNTYIIRDYKGNSLQALINSSYINAYVGLGKWPVEVRGLLANANNNPQQIATRQGKVLSTPLSFEDIYGEYATSWRISERESVLSACKQDQAENSVPEKPFYAEDLEPEVREKAKEVCTGKGVQEGPLLQACILDVAVIGDEAAAEVFTKLPSPVATEKDSAGLPSLLKWLALLALIALLIFWFFKKKNS